MPPAEVGLDRRTHVFLGWMATHDSEMAKRHFPVYRKVRSNKSLPCGFTSTGVVRSVDIMQNRTKEGDSESSLDLEKGDSLIGKRNRDFGNVR